MGTLPRLGRSRASRRTVAGALALGALGGCGDVQAQRRRETPAPHPAGATAAGAAQAPAPALHALLINGGGSAEDNFKSHLLHLREIQALLQGAGVADDRLVVHASDGDDPQPDVAVRGLDPEGLWLLEGTGLADRLAEPLTFENSQLPGAVLLPATRAALKASLRGLRARLVPGDTLLLYVTDHGIDDSRDPRGNQISLWGRREGITVTQLGAELSGMKPGVRVLAVMSQCFSGGFAHLLEVGARDGLPSGDVCGYFASTADRPAFGCYPEAAAVDRVGHSFALFDALGESGDLPAAHGAVLVSDQTPDVPLRTSDAFLAERLQLAATRSGQPDVQVADAFLREARRRAQADRLALAARVAASYGLPPPESLAQLDPLQGELVRLREQLENYRHHWQTALADLTRANHHRLLAEQPRWVPRLRPRALDRLSDPARRQLTSELLTALVAILDRNPATRDQLKQLLARLDDASAAGYRMEIREAALLRQRILLTSAAGQAYLETQGSRQERESLAALERCESLNLAPRPGRTPGGASPGRPPPTAAPPFPPLVDDRKLVAELRPSWMGLDFKEVKRATRGRRSLPDGAALVTAVQPGSPAAQGGLATGDIVLGPPGAPFAHPGQIRALTMLWAAGHPLELAVLRGSRRLVQRVTPAELPLPAPSRPGGGRRQERNRAK